MLSLVSRSLAIDLEARRHAHGGPHFCGGLFNMFAQPVFVLCLGVTLVPVRCGQAA